MWPGTASELVGVQLELARLTPPPWQPTGPRPLVAGCFICFGRLGPGPDGQGEPAWAAAALVRGDRRSAGTAVVAGSTALGQTPQGRKFVLFRSPGVLAASYGGGTAT